MPTVVNFKKKLDYLYRTNSKINNRTKLADYLGVNPNNITIWINGQKPHRAPEQIPNIHIPKLVKLHGLDPANQEDYDSYQKKNFAELVNYLESAHADNQNNQIVVADKYTDYWNKLISNAEESDVIAFIEKNNSKPAQIEVRIFDIPGCKSNNTPPTFSINTEIRINIDLNTIRKQQSYTNHFYLTVLSHDDYKTQSLCPNPSAYCPAPEVTNKQEILQIPDSGNTSEFMYMPLREPHGVQTIYMICAPNPLAQNIEYNIHKEMKSDQHSLTNKTKTDIAKFMLQQPQAVLIYKYPFLVIHAN